MSYSEDENEFTYPDNAIELRSEAEPWLQVQKDLVEHHISNRDLDIAITVLKALQIVWGDRADLVYLEAKINRIHIRGR